MAITTGARPADLDGCWAEWTEQDVDNVLRTDMDNGNIKSRRRFTGLIRKASVGVNLPADKFNSFTVWFRVNCRAGAIPTMVTTPYGTQEAWCFAEPPVISWIDKSVFSVKAEIYRLDGWP